MGLAAQGRARGTARPVTGAALRRSTRLLWPLVAALAAWQVVAALLGVTMPDTWLAMLATSAVAACVAYLGIEVVLLGGSWTDAGLAPARAPAQFVGGVLGGVLLMSCIVGGLWLAGWYEPRELLRPNASRVAAALLAWTLVAVAEELVFRGMITRRIAMVWGAPAALVGGAFAFGFAHAGAVDSAVGVLVVGASGSLLFGAAWLATGSLWAPLGLHLGWNLAQDALVSVDQANRPSAALVRATLDGPSWITGGADGLESGAAVLLACSSVAYVLVIRRRAAAELSECVKNTESELR